MEKSMSTNLGHYFNHLTCTFFVVLGLLGLFAPVSHAASGAFTFSTATYAASEGTGKINITINRVGGSIGTASVQWQTNAKTALNGKDYAGFGPTTVSFAAGETKKIQSITLTNDSLIESNETFKLTLSNPGSGTTLGTIATAVVTILDNDTIAVDTTAPTASLTSPSTGTTLTSAQTVTVAASATDNVGVSKVELYDGATLKGTDTTAPYNFAWAITSANNGSHSLTVKAYDAAGNSKVSTVAAVTIKIPVAAPGTFTFPAATSSVGEGNGNASITINRVGGSTGIVTVGWRTITFNGYGTADWATDYGTVAPQTLTFANGETSKTISVKLNQDSVIEGDETFTVALENPTGGASLGSVRSTIVTIKDDDQTPVQSSTIFYGYDPQLGDDDDPWAAPYGGVPRYVDPISGTNAGSGSINNPWKDLNYALRNCGAGDSIYLRGGVHNYAVSTSSSVKSTQANPVEVRSYPGEWAVIDGRNVRNGSSLVRISGESWLIFRNFEVRYSDINIAVASGLYLYNVHDSEFHNIYAHHNNGSGIKIYGSNRNKFYNCTTEENYDPAGGGDNADGISFNSGVDNKLYRCVFYHNSDDGLDTWGAINSYCEDCISSNNGFGSTGNGNGFKLGGTGLAGGHTLKRCLATNNKTRGFDENGAAIGSKFYNCVAYNAGWANWRLASAPQPHTVTNCISMGSGTGGDSFTAARVTTSLGGQLGGTVQTTSFESVNLADMNNRNQGRRLFYPNVSSTQLIDKGTNIGLSYRGVKPDIGIKEY